MKLTKLQIGSSCLLAIVLALTVPRLSGQGTFPPPSGPTTPIMKTLQQIEPRVDVLNSAGSNGVTTDATHHFIIGSPGSYYLTANLAVTKTNGIQVNSDGVTLDLNGFEISRGSGTGGNAIDITANTDHATITNGSVRGFAYGVNGVVSTPYPRNTTLRGLRGANCTTTGLAAGPTSLLAECAAHDCGIGISAQNHSVFEHCSTETCTGLYGIYAEANATMTDCTAARQINAQAGSCGIYLGNGSTATRCASSGNATDRGILGASGVSLRQCSANSNTVTYGIEVGGGSTLTESTANLNTSAAATSGGILGGANCVIQQCGANSNNSSAGTLSSTTGLGFNVGGGSTVQSCTASSNKGDGIDANIALIKQCTVNGNNQFGIFASQRCTISECMVTSNIKSGIRGDLVGSIINCICSFNGSCGILIESNGGFDVRGNTCEENGKDAVAQGAGIRVNGSFTRVEDNHIYVNYRGIDVNVVGVLVVRNAVAASISGINFNIVTGNKVGPIVSAPASGAINGNTGGAGVGSTDPWANISY